MKKAIIIGATSGIGRELAKVLAQKNYITGLVGRRTNLLTELQKEIQSRSYTKRIDVSKTEEAMALLEELIKEMNGIDLVIISSGVSFPEPKLNWEKDKQTIDVNVSGFVAMANAAGKFFYKQGYGHIVGISSIVAFKYSKRSTAYCASKAFVSNYLKGFREKLIKLGVNVHVTEVLPGFVDTPMVKDRKGMFWVASAKKAANQIYDAIKHKKRKVYITKRWSIIALLFRITPDFIKRNVH